MCVIRSRIVVLRYERSGFHEMMGMREEDALILGGALVIWTATVIAREAE